MGANSSADLELRSRATVSLSPSTTDRTSSLVAFPRYCRRTRLTARSISPPTPLPVMHMEIKARDLIAAGWHEGRRLGPALRRARELEATGLARAARPADHRGVDR